VLALAAAVTGWLFWRIDRKHPALGISSTLAAGVVGDSLSATAMRP
jgi:hypothetical protein